MKNYVSESFPNAIDFGFCIVGQQNKRTFPLTNHLKTDVAFKFEDSAFEFEPASGIIPPKNTVNITVTFKPLEAVVVVANSILTVENEPPRVIKLSAIGKYPYISLGATKIDFETILIGKKVTKDLIIKNQSQVPAEFEIKKIEDDDFKDNSFSFDVTSGEIPSKSTFLIKVTYDPKIAFLDSVSHYQVICKGGNTVDFELKGSATGYDVQLSTKSIDFGEIQLGTTTSRVLTVHNMSDLPIPFQFFNDKKNVFSLSATEGVVKGKSTFRIIVTFNPPNTMNYYERIYCLVSNHGVLYVDLIGCCYDLLIRPKPIKQRNVDVFRKRIIEGKYRKEDLVNIRTLTYDATLNNQTRRMMNTSVMNKTPFNGTQMDQTDRQQELTPVDASPENPNQVVLHKELFLELSSPNRLISLNQEYLDFGFCDPLTLSQQQELVVTNNLFYQVTLYWVPQTEKTENGQSLSVFNIYPTSAVIKPQQSSTFSVTFRPPKGSSYYFQKLQFFALRHDPKKADNLFTQQKKKLKDNTTMIQEFSPTNKSTLIIEDEVQPPVSGSIPCIGHSFSLTSQTFIPIVDVYPTNKIYFKPCAPNENVFTTVQLVNRTDTPIYYKFGYDVNKAFRVYPPCGLIEGKSFNLISFEFSPKEAKTYAHAISCTLNHNMSDQIHFKLFGFCFEPRLQLQNNGEIYFPPSFTGVVSKQKFELHNISRVPLEYIIEVPKKYENELFIKPNQKVLKPNEIIHLLCSFVPFKKKAYKIKVPIKVLNVIDPLQNITGFHLPGSGSLNMEPERKESNYELMVFGMGGDDSLAIQPELLDFGIVKVNFSEKRFFTIENFSHITFYVKIQLKPKNEENMTKEMKYLIQNSFKLDFNEGIIAGNSKLEIGITFTPIDIFEVDVILECIATEKLPEDATHDKKIFSKKCELEIKAQGSFPKLKFVDVRNDAISVSSLWENFSINKINKELLTNLNEDERKYNKLEQLSFEEAQALQKKLKVYDWNFGYLANKHPIRPRKVVITIQNIGGTDLEWKFNMPSDSYVAAEPWADPGEPTEEEAFEKAMVERRIFEIKPKHGVLPAGERAEIQLFYSPSFDEKLSSRSGGKGAINEEHYLRVVLHVINGKPIALNLRGMTLAPMKGLLAIKKTHHTFPPVPIGSLLPAMYPIEIQNVGSGKITYKAETSALDIYSDEKIKSSTKLLDIQNPSKTLNPGEKSYLYCLFKPLEAKKYDFKLPIIVSDFVGVIQELEVNLSGQGYNMRPPKDDHTVQEEIPTQRSFVSQLGSKVFFSIEELDFGEVESQKPQYRLVLLYNAHKARRLSYDFFKTGLVCEDDLQIDPPNGIIEPQSFAQLKITLIPNVMPSFYEGEIECQVTWHNPGSQDAINNPHMKQESDDKELLFLRIKKKSKFLNEKKKFIPLENVLQYQENRADKHPFEVIMTKIINDVLNDPATEDMLQKISKLPVQLYGQFDKEEPANIHKISPGLDDKIVKPGADFRDFRNMFFQEEFIDLVDSIMENTFFNIIQQTTLKEIDLLKPSKIYLSPV